MYTQFFRLTERPFSIAPNPRFLFLSPRHQEGLAHLLYGTAQSGGFVALTGEVGTGKTTLCQCLLQQLPEDVDIALILNPRVNAVELLAALCDELQIAYPAGTKSLKLLVDIINNYLLDAFARGRRTVVMIDEAQNLSFDVLEQVRLLTNLETSETKLLQIILVGQPELTELLEKNELRQLAQRITARCHLTALSFKETAEYIRHRLLVAGCGKQPFKKSAVRTIYQFSGGIPRLINTICDRALLGAYTQGRKTINSRIAGVAAREVLAPHHWPVFSRPAFWVAATTVLLLGFGVGLFQDRLLELQSKFGFALNGIQFGEVEAKSIEPMGTISGSAVPNPINQEITDNPKPTDQGSARRPVLIKIGDSEKWNDVEQQTFGEFIRNPKLDVDTAFAQLFTQWGLGHSNHTNDCDGAQDMKLRCLTQVDGWNRIVQLNRPVVMEFKSASGIERYVTLANLNGNQLVFKVNNKPHSFHLKEVLPFWRGFSVLFWKPPRPKVKVLRGGQTLPVVQSLRDQMTAVTGFLKPESTDSHFDDRLVTRVMEFQRRNGLKANGVVGPHTFIQLNNTLSTPGIPKLELRRRIN